MTNNTPTRITWSDDDKVDPYPAILEALGEVFAFARSPEADNMGGSEPDIINAMMAKCRGVLLGRDSTSMHLMFPKS